MFDTILTPNPSPFSGKPRTVAGTDASGAPTFTVRATALHPFVAKWSARAGIMAGVALFGAELYWLVTAQPSLDWADWVTLATAPIATPFVVKFGVRHAFKTERVIRFSSRGVTVRGALGDRTFDLNLPLRFSLLAHDREKSETERLEHLNRKWGRRYWWFPRFQPYLNKSSHLSLEHFDQRNDLMTIYGKDEARRIQARLNACLDVVRNHGRAGQGTAFEAESDWSRQPGEIVDG
ncbi:MAG: hypothetical protein AAF416_12205 [Pseudomonadota bacterium]